MVFQTQPARYDAVVEYRVLPGENVSYDKIILAIGDMMESAGMLPELAMREASSLPLVIETVGAIDVTKLLLGVPLQQEVALTTLAQSEKVALDMLARTGAESMSLVLAGIHNGGMRSFFPRQLRIDGVVGTMNNLSQLQRALAEKNATVSISFDPQYVYRDSLNDGFNASGNTARLLTSAIASKPDYTLSTMHMKSGGMSAYMANGDAIAAVTDSFKASAEAQGLYALSLSSMARDIYSDFRKGEYISREDMKTMLAKTLDRARDGEMSLMARGANAYALPYLSLVYDLPMAASANPLISHAVPMTQMILSGKIPYAGSSVQYANNAREYLLRLLESGAGVSLQAFFAPAETVKYTDFDYLYAGNYESVASLAAATYTEAAAALEGLWGAEITGHRREGAVAITQYGDAGTVYVNYGAAPVTLQDAAGIFTVNEMDYAVRKVGR